MRTRQEFLSRHWANEHRATALISEAVTATILLYPYFDSYQIQNAYNKLYLLIMKSEADITWKEFVKQEAEGISSALLFAIYEYIAIHALAKALEVGASIFSAAKESLTPMATDAEKRAFAREQEAKVRSIARTETTIAMNQGSIIALQKSGLPWEKSWVAVRDENTRNAHAVKSPTEYIRLDEAFIVGGEQLVYPADTSLGASASNTINCRCSMNFRLARGR